MRDVGISDVRPGPNLSKRNQQHLVYPYLLRNIRASYNNHVWGIDISYIRTTIHFGGKSNQINEPSYNPWH